MSTDSTTIKPRSEIGIRDVLMMLDAVLENPKAYLVPNMTRGYACIAPFANGDYAKALADVIKNFCKSRDTTSYYHVTGAGVGYNTTLEEFPDYEDHVYEHHLLPEEITSQRDPEYSCLELMINRDNISFADSLEAIRDFRTELLRSLHTKRSDSQEVKR